MTIKVDILVFAVFLNEEDDVAFGAGHVVRAEQQTEGAKVPTDDRAFRFPFVQHEPPLVGDELWVVLVARPVAIHILRGRRDRIRLVVEVAAHEGILRVLKSLLLPEVEEVGARVRHQSRLRVDRVAESRDVREATQALRVLPDEVVVNVLQELVAVVAADDRQDELHGRVRERIVQVFNAMLHRGGTKRITLVDVLAERHRQAEGFQPLLGEAL